MSTVDNASGRRREQPWPSRVIDPHIHQWDPVRTPRHGSSRARLLRPLPRVPHWFRWLAPRAEREFVGQPHHVLKPYLPGDYRDDTADIPVGSVVHIEAAWQGPPVETAAETRWVTSLPWGLDGAPELGAVVVHADPRWPEAAAVLDAHLAGSPLVRGVRHSVTHHPDPGVRDFERSADVLARPDFLDGFAAIAERGLSFELWVYSHQLPHAQRLVAAYPETTFVLDHYATPVGAFNPRGTRTVRSAGERASLLARWRDDVAALATCPNVVAKHSGLGMPVLGGPLRRGDGTPRLDGFVDAVGPLVRHLHNCFGVDRTMWASNYPIDKPVLPLPTTAQVVLDVLGSDADPQRLFHDVAARTYRIDIEEKR